MTGSDTVAEIVSQETLRSRIEELGAQLAADYVGKVPVLVGILNGSIPFLADLSRACPIELEVDFLGLTRFGEGGRVDIAFDCASDLTDRHVVLVEDIVDTGLTLSSLRGMIEIRRPASLETVTLIDKSARRLVDVPLEYRGFEVGDEFLIGYGMDWENSYRNLPSLWSVMDFGAFVLDPGCLGRAALAGRQ
ncbi:MAG: hypoxanthine phosphoribosyltransferase [Acidimicrobiia bacterium]|nr:hypoxanthine phosphoribosyltransferase [Acidimicrobiia bacterium]